MRYPRFGADDQDVGESVEEMYRDLGDHAMLRQEESSPLRRAERTAGIVGRIVGGLIAVSMYLAAYLALVALAVLIVHLLVRFAEVVWRLT